MVGEAGQGGGTYTLKVVVFPPAHPSSLIFSFSQNSGVCKQEWGPCLLMRTGGDEQTASTVCVFLVSTCVSACACLDNECVRDPERKQACTRAGWLR